MVCKLPHAENYLYADVNRLWTVRSRTYDHNLRTA